MTSPINTIPTSESQADSHLLASYKMLPLLKEEQSAIVTNTEHIVNVLSLQLLESAFSLSN